VVSTGTSTSDVSSVKNALLVSGNVGLLLSSLQEAKMIMHAINIKKAQRIIVVVFFIVCSPKYDTHIIAQLVVFVNHL
jgi:hypothetical protein